MTNSPSPKPSNTPKFSTGLAFRNFASEVTRHRRYIHSGTTKRFLDAVAATSAERYFELPAGSHVWRAQQGSDWRPIHDKDLPDGICEPYPFSKGRMKPLLDKAIEGRANPTGVPCLYVATTELAAISEVRPWVGSLVSIGRFRITRPLRIVDCSKHHDELPMYFLEEPAIELRDLAVWTDIDRAFAEPVARSDDSTAYVPTQILAELFRSMGADGVKYKSAFGDDAYSIALFDLNAAELIRCRLAHVDIITFGYIEFATGYDEVPNSESSSAQH